MAVDYLGAIGAGSGLNTSEIVSSLVAAERAPQQSALDRMKEKADVRISAFGVVKSALNSLKESFDRLDDLSDVKQLSFSSSNSAAVTGSATSSAAVGSYSIEVTQLAERDSWTFDGFDSLTESLNSGQSITLSVVKGGVTTEITVDAPTPEKIVTELNNAGLGLSASLVDTGAATNRFVLSVAGESGIDNAFTVSATAGLSGATQTTNAANANLKVNGISISRASNAVSDALDGITLNLNQVSESLTVQIAPNRDEVKTRITDLVTTFNDVKSVFNELQNGDDSEDELIGSLASDSTLRNVIRSVQNKLTSQISTASGDVNYLTDIGIGFTREGTLEISESRLDEILAASFDDVVTALTADTENQTEYGEASRGLAGDMSVLIGSFTKTLGSVSSEIRNAEEALSTYETRMAELDARMVRIQERYTQQFSAMQQIIDQMNSTSDYLTNQLSALNSND